MIKNKTKNIILVKKPTLIRGHFLSKSIGLMFHSKLQDQGMLFNFNIENKYHFHMLFVFQSLDFLFLDRNRRVTKVVHAVKPWTLNVSGQGKYVLELPADSCKGTSVGDTISFK